MENENRFSLNELKPDEIASRLSALAAESFLVSRLKRRTDEFFEFFSNGYSSGSEIIMEVDSHQSLSKLSAKTYAERQQMIIFILLKNIPHYRMENEAIFASQIFTFSIHY